MNEFKFYVPRKLPGLNEIIKWSKQPIPWLSKGKRRVYQYTLKKKEIEAQIISDIYQQLSFLSERYGTKMIRLPKFESCRIDFKWFEANRRRDPSNVCAGGRKFVLDALVSIGVLKNDNWLVGSHSDIFVIDKKQVGVEVKITATQL